MEDTVLENKYSLKAFNIFRNIEAFFRHGSIKFYMLLLPPSTTAIHHIHLSRKDLKLNLDEELSSLTSNTPRSYSPSAVDTCDEIGSL
mgnify:CR=1 FL=1